MFECSEQLLFSCVSLKVIVRHAIHHMSYFTYHMSNVKGQMLILILGTYMLNNFCFHVYAQKSLFIAEQFFYESKATYISSVITEARGKFRHMYSDNVECIYCNNCDFQSQSHLNSNMIKLFRTVPIYSTGWTNFL